MFAMKRISLALCALLIFSACNKQDPDQKDQNPGFSFGNPLSVNRPLNASERSLATTACELLRDKRDYFETLEDNRWEFEFNGSETVCGNINLPTTRYITRLRVPTRGPLHFDSNFRRYMSDILTDKDGFLSHYCGDLLAGTNTNLIQEVGGKRVQLSMGAGGAYLIAQAAWYYPDSNGVFKPYLLDKVTIFTKASTGNRRYYGVIKDRAQHRPCDDKTIRTFKQSLIR
jgi:hypothetical protein